jgi:hypothetical protein
MRLSSLLRSVAIGAISFALLGGACSSSGGGYGAIYCFADAP